MTTPGGVTDEALRDRLKKLLKHLSGDQEDFLFYMFPGNPDTLEGDNLRDALGIVERALQRKGIQLENVS